MHTCFLSRFERVCWELQYLYQINFLQWFLKYAQKVSPQYGGDGWAFIHGRDERAFPVSTHKKLHRVQNRRHANRYPACPGQRNEGYKFWVLARSEKLSGRMIGNHLGAKGRPMVKMKSVNFMSSVPSFLFLYLWIFSKNSNFTQLYWFCASAFTYLFLPSLFCDAIINRIVFLISFSGWSLLVYGNTITFCLLILYPEMLLNLLL